MLRNAGLCNGAFAGLRCAVDAPDLVLRSLCSFVSVEERIEALEAHVDNRLQRIEQLLIRSMALSNDLGAQ